MKCRHCLASIKHNLVDLGFAPPSNSYLTSVDLSRPETYYPLRVLVCDQCWLVQTQDFVDAEELFSTDYAYFSSTSTVWLDHAFRFVTSIIPRLRLSKDSFVLEIASNDGYLLKNFVELGIPCLGIEPTESTALASEDNGINVLREFFSEQLGKQLALQGKQADLIVANNVYAHVPNINDFSLGLKAALKPGGTLTLEFPHLMQLIENVQFDTIYHEHFSYLSVYSVSRILQNAGLRVLDVEELSTHGGSLRVFACHFDDERRSTSAVECLLQREDYAGLRDMATYKEFQLKVNRIKNELLVFLIEQKRLGKTVAGFGAAAKGSTLLNFAGINPDLLPFISDSSTSKQGKFMPGSHIPILSPAAVDDQRPDFLFILPWNIRDEIISANSHIRQWGGQFVTAIPKLQIQQ
jgi:SAM-dependent methyltransferase